MERCLVRRRQKGPCFDPFTLTNANALAGGSFQFGFTNITDNSFFTFVSTNLSLPSSTCTVLGAETEISSG
jgi:hypothetical protein